MQAVLDGVRRAGLRSAVFLALIACVYVPHLAWIWHFTPDDAAISYAYALHLKQGLGFRAVIGGPTVEGYSNFLWVLILVGASNVGLAIPLAGKIVGAL